MCALSGWQAVVFWFIITISESVRGVWAGDGGEEDEWGRDYRSDGKFSNDIGAILCFFAFLGDCGMMVETIREDS
jgi:hypothetical protein